MTNRKFIAKSLAIAALSMAVTSAHAGLMSSCTAKLATSPNTTENLAKKAQCVVKEGMGNPNFLTALVASAPCQTIFAKYKSSIKAAKASVKSRNQSVKAGGDPSVDNTVIDYSFMNTLNQESLNALVACYGAKKLKKTMDTLARLKMDQSSYKAKTVSSDYAKAFMRKLLDARDMSTHEVAVKESQSQVSDGGSEGASEGASEGEQVSNEGGEQQE